MIGALTRQRRQLRRQRGKGLALLRLQPCGIEHRPGAVEFNRAVDGNQRLRGQRLCGVDQLCGLRTRLALRAQGQRTLLGKTVHAAVTVAQSPLGLLESLFTSQRVNGRQLDRQRRRRLRECHQGGVVAQRGLQPSVPVDDGRWRGNLLRGRCLNGLGAAAGAGLLGCRTAGSGCSGSCRVGRASSGCLLQRAGNAHLVFQNPVQHEGANRANQKARIVWAMAIGATSEPQPPLAPWQRGSVSAVES